VERGHVRWSAAALTIEGMSKLRDVRHIPVLIDPVLKFLAPQAGQTFVDCTLGLGGHSAAILQRIAPGGRLVAIDFDPVNIALARSQLEATGATVTTHPVDIPASRQAVVATPFPIPLSAPAHPPAHLANADLFHTNFAGVPGVLQELGIERVDGLLADIGVASTQIDDPARGFSYRQPGPLDMRMDPTRGQPASALLARISERELAEAILQFGDETDAPEIASLIVRRRKEKPILTTQDLMTIVCEARDFTIERGAGAKLHPAARTFQALRILVNRELANLERLLTVLPSVLKPGGVAVIISFHSGEDRTVKQSFREGLREGIYSEISPEPVIADETEQRVNPRSRSAKLRWARLAV